MFALNLRSVQIFYCYDGASCCKALVMIRLNCGEKILGLFWFLEIEILVILKFLVFENRLLAVFCELLEQR